MTMPRTTELATVQPQETGITNASLQHTKGQLALLEQFVKDVLRPGQDFGIIPGTKSPTLLKPGASNIISAFNCHAEPHIDRERLEINDDTGLPFAGYTVHVDIVSNLTGNVVSRGFGQCNSYERKYRYRQDQRRCPHCGAAAILKGKEEFGGGWICWARRDGCGAKFQDGDPTIEGQSAGQIENPDPLDQANTYLKMAIKRAEVDAALRLPGVARFFTQDLEDIMGVAEPESDKETPKPPAPVFRGSRPTPAPSAKPTPAPRKAATGPLISSAEANDLMKHADEANVTRPHIMEYIMAKYNLNSPLKLTPEQRDEVWVYIDIQAGVTEEAPPDADTATGEAGTDAWGQPLAARA